MEDFDARYTILTKAIDTHEKELELESRCLRTREDDLKNQEAITRNHLIYRNEAKRRVELATVRLQTANAMLQELIEQRNSESK